MIAVRTWGIFSSYGGDGPSNIMFVQRRQNSYIVGRNTSEFSSRLGRAIGTPFQVRQETQGLSCCHRDIGIPINFQEESGIISF